MSKLVERAYRYRFYPTDIQKENLAKTFGCCRFSFNTFLALKTKTWKEEKRSISYKECSVLLKELKRENPWLKEVSSVCLQQSQRHLDHAFQRFFQQKGNFPRFKKRHGKQSASYMKNAFKYEGGQITLAKQKDPLHIRWSRFFKGEPTSLTITLDPCGRYHISIVVKEEVKTKPFKKGEVGIDLGLINSLTEHTGKTIGNPRYFNNQLKKLKKKQRTLSKKVKGSNNYSKARRQVAIAHTRVRDRRKDFLHKESTRLVNENQVIVVETLKVRKMIRTRHLSRSIADAGWRTLVNYLEYKCEWYGKELIKVDTYFPSSKRCSKCGYELKELSLSTRRWECPNCRATHNRDENAAKNILTEGLYQREKQKRIPRGARELKLVEFV